MFIIFILIPKRHLINWNISVHFGHYDLGINQQFPLSMVLTDSGFFGGLGGAVGALAGVSTVALPGGRARAGLWKYIQ